jgi:hypothetical protein
MVSLNKHYEGYQLYSTPQPASKTQTSFYQPTNAFSTKQPTVDKWSFSRELSQEVHHSVAKAFQISYSCCVYHQTDKRCLETDNECIDQFYERQYRFLVMSGSVATVVIFGLFSFCIYRMIQRHLLIKRMNEARQLMLSRQKSIDNHRAKFVSKRKQTRLIEAKL